MSEIGLGEALQKLREELYRAQAEGTGQQVRLQVEKAELELGVEFQRDADGSVKVAVGVFGAKAEAGAGVSVGSVHRQRLTLTLNVLDAAAGRNRLEVSRGHGAAGDEGADDPAGEADDDGGPRPWERVG